MNVDLARRALLAAAGRRRAGQLPEQADPPARRRAAGRNHRSRGAARRRLASQRPAPHPSQFIQIPFAPPQLSALAVERSAASSQALEPSNDAIKEIRKYLQRNPKRESSRTLARLAAALAEENEFPLAGLYRLDYDAFELAMQLMQDWRLDRYYAARIKLFDVVLNDVLPDLKDQ
jgi:hypothetical protein